MKVRNMTSRKGRNVPNQFIIEGEREITFQSYESKIAEWDGSILTIYKDWDRSRTTMKCLKMFINENTSLKYTTRKDFEKQIKRGEDIERGE